ncbi:MAG TPA: hypothetical protein VGG28_31420 [Kofleriaceae bacterium]
MNRDVYIALIVAAILPLIAAPTSSGGTLCGLMLAAGVAGLVVDRPRVPRARVIDRR